MRRAVKNKAEKKEPEIHIKPESTWLNPGITTIEQLKDWVITKLGYPLVSVELTDEQLNSCIADALSIYSKYAYLPEKFLTVNLKYYEHGKGIDLSEFNIMSVKNIGLQRDNIWSMHQDMFFGPYAFLGQGAGGPMFGLGSGNAVGSWVTFHNVQEWFHMADRLMGSNPDWQYDKTTKRLVLMPEPHCKHDHYILLTCNVQPPVEEYYGNEYVRRLVLAEAKILLGTIRKKYAGVQLVGGGTIDTSIGDEGREEKSQIMENIIRDESKGQFFCVS